MNLYITGDTHGNFVGIRNFCENNKNLSAKNDMIIILGDSGINYYVKKNSDGNYVSEKSAEKLKEKLAELPITFFSIHGNHEARPNSMKSYLEKEYHGGIVYYEKAYPNLLFAKDGEIYEFNNEKYLVMGGAYSIDKYYRIMRNLNWFEDEQPSDEIKKRIEEKCEENHWKIDYVLSHTCPYQYMPIEAFLAGVNEDTVDNSTERWLGKIEEKLMYKKWFCGHFHICKLIDKIEFLFQDIKLMQ